MHTHYDRLPCRGAWSFSIVALGDAARGSRVGSHSTGPQEHPNRRQEPEPADRQSKPDPVVPRSQEWAAWDELIACTTGVDAQQGERGDDTGSRDDEGEGEQYPSFHPSKV
jgi:hypothetical protein